MQRIVECVANFSEGRRIEVVDQIVAAIASVKGVYILDHESDADHNRSVISFVGDPDSIAEAAFRGIQKAAELIDLDQHTGEHPRLGATDVVPFIPIEGVTMADCVAIARALGKRVGDELGIPVYLYEEAATRPDRQNLADVRKGQYEKLKEDLGKDPNRDPDFGPKTLPKAGATIIGARAPLIAYNVYLNTTNIDIAKQIGKTIRHSSGGLRYVKALGLDVNGMAQVSMNLTNYQATPIYLAQEMIRTLAARHGVSISHSEIVGLIPQRALVDAGQWYLQIDGFKPEQILEVRLSQVLSQADTAAGTSAFLDELASDSPAPGGGSAAAYSGAMAASLVAMVARLTLGKKKYAEVEGRMQDIIAEADKLRNELHAAVQQDAEAFNRMMEAFRLPKESDAEKAVRATAIEQATIHAAEVPLQTARLAYRALELAVEVAQGGNTSAITDAGTAGSLAQTAIYAAGLNVKINASSLQDKTRAAEWLATLADLEGRASQRIAELQTAMRERGGIQI
jgi:glutamate formiminotransferase/formiminotetrahydrofolate cyclodeaminase